jgi:hypothetical protein
MAEMQAKTRNVWTVGVQERRADFIVLPPFVLSPAFQNLIGSRSLTVVVLTNHSI